MTQPKLVPPLKYHGGKMKIANWIHQIALPIEDFYKHRVYAFGGAMGEAWNWKYEGISECYNDIDGRLTNFFAVLQNEFLFQKFLRKAQAIPFSETEWEANHFINQLEPVTWDMKPNDRVLRALALFVDCRQSLTGMMEGFAPLSKTRTRRGMNEQASAWLNAIDGLPQVHKRLIRMAIKNVSWEKLIDQEDSPKTLFYLDPLYLKETRVAKDVYKHEMDYGDHFNLLERLTRIKGKFMLSGYHSELYDKWAVNNHIWIRDLVTDAKASHKDKKDTRTETIWSNF